MYTLYLWMCLTTNPNCQMWETPQHIVLVFPANSKEECENKWKASLTEPDPPGMKSYYVCRLEEVPL